MNEFIDASVFLGMHSKDEWIRVKCKNFFVRRMKKTVFMSLEDVGKCDDVIWGFSREIQDAYYPFMDRIHTIMNIKRIPFTIEEVTLVNQDVDLQNLKNALSVALAKLKGGVLYTVKEELSGVLLDEIKAVPDEGVELTFPEDLEDHYKKSLVLRIKDVTRI